MCLPSRHNPSSISIYIFSLLWLLCMRILELLLAIEPHRQSHFETSMYMYMYWIYRPHHARLPQTLMWCSSSSYNKPPRLEICFQCASTIDHRYDMTYACHWVTTFRLEVSVQSANTAQRRSHEGQGCRWDVKRFPSGYRYSVCDCCGASSLKSTCLPWRNNCLFAGKCLSHPLLWYHGLRELENSCLQSRNADSLATSHSFSLPLISGTNIQGTVICRWGIRLISPASLSPACGTSGYRHPRACACHRDGFNTYKMDITGRKTINDWFGMCFALGLNSYKHCIMESGILSAKAL
jgi:hypothetical protein